MFDAGPFTEQQIWKQFHHSGSISKHLLSIYSFALGMNAKKILDIGVGATTKALRLVAEKTDGVVLSCDANVKRFSSLMEKQDRHWKLYLCASETFLKTIEGPFDFVSHDGAHDYYQVKLDLQLILPKMRTFGLICIHDTHHPVFGHDVLAAIKEATRGWRISMTNLPFSSGLAIMRVEEGKYPSEPFTDGSTPQRLKATAPVACPMYFEPGLDFAVAERSIKRWVTWKLRKIVKGY